MVESSRSEAGPRGHRQIRIRQKEAAFKAWKTIRKKRWHKRAMGSRLIVEYVEPAFMGRLKHPEVSTGLKSIEFPTSFGRGVVSQFHKTPEDIACGPFWELRWAFGCPLDCNYCYLRGTLRGRMKPSFVHFESISSALDEAFRAITHPSLFNSGELSDSLMNPALMAQIADKFEKQTKHKLGLLSKFGPRNVRFLLTRPRRQVVCAWSVNAIEVAGHWERAAAHPTKRIEAARLVKEAGYDTRIRFDPIFPIKDWKKHYEDIIYRLFSALEPNRIVLGTPRGLAKTIFYAQREGINMEWTQFFREDSGWGKKLSFEDRIEIYGFFLDKLSSVGYDLSKVTLCKETLETWDALGKKAVPITCNCYGYL